MVYGPLSMKAFCVLTCLLMSAGVQASGASVPVTEITIPYMERPALHRRYVDELLKLALDNSVEKFGPYELAQQTQQTAIERQLRELANNRLSVATNMPKKEWLDTALIIQFPLLKGLASYRLFFTTKKHLDAIRAVQTIEDLKGFKIGQGKGWSTSDILTHHGFEVVYAHNYSSLLPMLAKDRYQLLMRGVYEVEQEYFANKARVPNLAVVKNVAIYTYLPMYFFVNKNNKALATRIEYGLKKAHESGQFDKLFNIHFWGALKLLDETKKNVFDLSNPSINASYYQKDKPYLLKIIHQ